MLTGGDGCAAEIGQFPVLAQNKIAAIQGHDGGALEAILAAQHPDEAVVGDVYGGSRNRFTFVLKNGKMSTTMP